MKEMIGAIRHLMNNKAAGIVDIPTELWKANIEGTVGLIAPLLVDIWAEEYLPSE